VRPLSFVRRTGTALVAAAVLAVLSPGTAHASQVQSYAKDFPDPFVLPVSSTTGTTYYAYATNTKHVAAHVQLMSSTDLTTWSEPKDALKALPKWAVAGHTWAPSVLAVGSTHVLYYTVRERKSNKQCISRAVSKVGPQGPFEDTSTGPMICQHRLGGSIDPNPFVDGSKLYLHWKSDDNAVGGIAKLWGSALSADGLKLSGTTKQLMKYDQKWEHPLVEAPHMVRTASGHYQLFYSGNWWESATAAVGYGSCSSPLGGCAKVTTDAVGPWLEQDAARVGTAGETFFTGADGKQYVAYHAWEPGHVGYADPDAERSLWINEVTFDEQGTPTLTK
jgi:hypothetical protein